MSNKEDLSKISKPDFFTSGEMPRMHRLYKDIHDFINKNNLDLDVTFPGWARGPWSVAWMLRGPEQLMIDFYENPTFVHGLMEFITDSRLEWEAERQKFLDLDFDEDYIWSYSYLDYRKQNKTPLFNDEVNGDLFSPKTYSEFILPYEKKIKEELGEISYYHSCGNLVLFIA